MFLIAIFLVVIFSVLVYITTYSFKKILMARRRTEDDVIDLLKKRGVYLESEFQDIDFEELEIISEDNLKLKGYYINKFPKSKKFIVMVHGYTANHLINLQYLNMFFEKGYNALLIDERSHGASEGKYPTYGIKEKDDLHRWIQLLREMFGDDIEIGLHGQSMGGATVLMYAGKYNDVKFVVSDCAYSDAKELMHYSFRKVLKYFYTAIYELTRLVIKIKCDYDIEEASPINYIKDKEIPVLFIHGTTDVKVPCYMSENMYKLKKGSNNKILIVKDAEHMKAYPKAKEEYKKVVYEFLNDITC